MTLIFAHDHRFVALDGTVYSSGAFPARIWERYLSAFDEVEVICRQGAPASLPDPEKRTVAAHDRVRFTFLPDLGLGPDMTARRRRARAVVEAALGGASAAVVRLPSEVGYLTAAAARRLGTPWAAEIAGCPWDGLLSHGSRLAKVYAPLAMHRMRRTVARAPFALFVTERFLQGRYPARSALEQAACSNVEIDPPGEDALTRRLARIGGIAERTPVRLGLIGTLKTRSKGIQTVMAALAQAPQALAEARFHVLGQGDPAPWIAEAQALGVADRVVFDGVRPPGQAVMDWLDDIDIYLQPSLKEGLPRALIEAMSRGCPALGSRCAGIPELLPDAELVPRGDATALAGLLARRLRDRPWQETSAARNLDRARAYGRPELDARRQAFWSSFAEFAGRPQHA